MSISDLIEAGGSGAEPAPQLHAGVARLRGGSVYAVLPSFSQDHDWGPLKGATGGLSEGEEIMVAFADDGSPWVLSVAGGESGPKLYSMLEVFGHSYTRASNASTGYTSWQAKLADMLKVQRTYNYGRGSAKTHDPSLGVGYVREHLLRTRTAGPYHPSSDLAVVMYGINDLSLVADARFFLQHLRNLLALVNATAVFENSDGSVAHSSGSTQTIASALACAGFHYNGGTERQITTTPSTTTITVPSDYPGSPISLQFRVTSADTVVGTITVDGNPAEFTDGSPAGVLSYAPADYCGENLAATVTKRLVPLAPGAHSIVVTYTSITGTARFDRWQIESPVAPVVAVCNVARITSPAATGYGEGDERVALWNAALPALIAEFDNAVLVDIDTPLGKSSAYFADGRHVNDDGMALIAKAIYDAIPHRKNTFVQQGGYPDNATTGLSLGSGWSAAGGSTPTSAGCKQQGGMVQCYGYVSKSTAPAANELIAILPVGMRPYYTQFFPAVDEQGYGVLLRVEGAAGVAGGTTNPGGIKWVASQNGTPAGKKFDLAAVRFFADR